TARPADRSTYGSGCAPSGVLRATSSRLESPCPRRLRRAHGLYAGVLGSRLATGSARHAGSSRSCLPRRIDDGELPEDDRRSGHTVIRRLRRLTLTGHHAEALNTAVSSQCDDILPKLSTAEQEARPDDPRDPLAALDLVNQTAPAEASTTLEIHIDDEAPHRKPALDPRNRRIEVQVVRAGREPEVRHML